MQNFIIFGKFSKCILTVRKAKNMIKTFCNDNNIQKEDQQA